MEIFKWGIIGAGNIAKDFLEDLKHLADQPQKVTAVVSHTITGAKDFASQCGVPLYYDDMEKFINDTKVDAVYIATPHTSHYEQALVCLQNKIPVLCEKPMAINSEQAKDLIRESAGSETFLMEGMWIRFLPSIKQVIELVQKDTIGQVIAIKATMSYKAPSDPGNRFFNPGLGGGSLLDLGIYPVYLSLLLLGRPAKIKALCKLSDKQIDESCAMLFQYEGGQYAILDSSIIVQTDQTATIYGDKGTIKILEQWNERPAGIVLQLYNGEVKKYPCQWQGRGLQYEVEEAVRCIKNKQLQSDLLSHQVSIDLAEIMEDIRRQVNITYEREPYEELLNRETDER